jgi:hypothetical protein
MPGPLLRSLGVSLIQNTACTHPSAEVVSNDQVVGLYSISKFGKETTNNGIRNPIRYFSYATDDLTKLLTRSTSSAADGLR